MKGRIAVTEASVLEWQVEASPVSLTWAEAGVLARTLGDGWRLPDAEELLSLVCYGKRAPATIQFPDTPPEKFWTATPVVREPGHAWAVSFLDGSVLPVLADEKCFVRLVRGGRP